MTSLQLDVVLLDLGMLGMDGYETCRQLGFLNKLFIALILHIVPMKVYWPAIFLTLISHSALAQLHSFDLNQGPVFITILKHYLIYLQEVLAYGIYDRLYTQFDIDPKDHIYHIALLHPISRDTRYGLEQTIRCYSLNKLSDNSCLSEQVLTYPIKKKQFVSGRTGTLPYLIYLSNLI